MKKMKKIDSFKKKISISSLVLLISRNEQNHKFPKGWIPPLFQIIPHLIGIPNAIPKTKIAKIARFVP